MRFFCPRPFRWLMTTGKHSMLCCCRARLPHPLGTYTGEPILDYWNNDIAQKIRQSIHDGSYQYCTDKCPFIFDARNRRLIANGREEEMDDTMLADEYIKMIDEKQLVILPKGPTHLNLGNDRSCNLACPACRPKLYHASKSEYSRIKKYQTKILSDVQPYLEWLSLTGAGDPFGGRSYRYILQETDFATFPNLKTLVFRTNANLLNESMWDSFAFNIQNTNNIIVDVSIDAASEESYFQIRGGNWHKLQSNLWFIAWLRKQGSVSRFKISMIVQKKNWREMPEFFAMGKRLGVDVIRFTILENWCFSEEVFADYAVHKPGHPNHQEFLNLIATPQFDDPNVAFDGIFLGLRNQALKAAGRELPSTPTRLASGNPDNFDA